MLIGIAGGSGAGKTAFINALRGLFADTQLGLLSEDNYYKPRELQQTDDRGVINFDIPGAIDRKAFITDLRKLKRRLAVERLEYTYNNERATARKIRIEPAPVYLVEGLFILHDASTRHLLDLAVLIHASDDKKIIRRIHRDQTERNYPLEDVLYRYQHHVAPAYQKFIEPHLADIDVIINNNRNFEKGLAMLSAFIREQL